MKILIVMRANIVSFAECSWTSTKNMFTASVRTFLHVYPLNAVHFLTQHRFPITPLSLHAGFGNFPWPLWLVWKNIKKKKHFFLFSWTSGECSQHFLQHWHRIVGQVWLCYNHNQWKGNLKSFCSLMIPHALFWSLLFWWKRVIFN